MKSARLTRTILLLVAEALLLYGSMMAAVYLRFSDADMRYELIERYALYKALLVTAFCLASFYFYDLYDFATMHDRRELILRLIQALGVAWVALSLAFYALPQLMIGRGVSLISLPLALCLTVGWRLLIHWILSHPDWGERVLIVGTSPEAVEMARETHARRDIGYRIIGFTGTDPELLGKSLFNPRVIGLNDELEEIVKRERIDRIVVAMGQRRGQFPTQQLLHLSLAGHVHIEEGAAFYERLTGRVYLDMVRPSWLIFEGPGRQARVRGMIRTFVHRGVALLGALVSLPVSLLTALLIKLESRGPVFYKQERVGKNGKTFMVYKFRSMRDDAEKNGPVWAAQGDSRVTRVGRVIRKLRIDEIPQFWNILRGEMNFVGPRPERPHFVATLAEEIPFYEQRHLIAPGLTGWAQIKYPYGATIEDARQKLQYDLYYIKNQNLSLDAVIIFETVKTVVFGRGL